MQTKKKLKKQEKYLIIKVFEEKLINNIIFR